MPSCCGRGWGTCYGHICMMTSSFSSCSVMFCTIGLRFVVFLHHHNFHWNHPPLQQPCRCSFIVSSCDDWISFLCGVGINKMPQNIRFTQICSPAPSACAGKHLIPPVLKILLSSLSWEFCLQGFKEWGTVQVLDLRTLQTLRMRTVDNKKDEHPSFCFSLCLLVFSYTAYCRCKLLALELYKPNILLYNILIESSFYSL